MSFKNIYFLNDIFYNIIKSRLLKVKMSVPLAVFLALSFIRLAPDLGCDTLSPHPQHSQPSRQCHEGAPGMHACFN